MQLEFEAGLEGLEAELVIGSVYDVHTKIDGVDGRNTTALASITMACHASGGGGGKRTHAG